VVKGKKKGLTSAARQSVTPVHQWRIESGEYDERVRRVRAELESRNLDGLVLFQPIRMAYVTGFFHLSTERPMAIVISREGGIGGLIPHLEEGHFAKANGITNTAVYPEYPTGGTKHPMHHLADLLKAMKLNARGIRLGHDNNGYLDINGYDGPALSEVVAGWVETVNARDIVDKLRAVKSAAELALIAESCSWGNLAHRLMHERVEHGGTPTEIGLGASVDLRPPGVGGVLGWSRHGDAARSFASDGTEGGRCPGDLRGSRRWRLSIGAGADDDPR
jgi:Xaa-Pro aminopeptidase